MSNPWDKSQQSGKMLILQWVLNIYVKISSSGDLFISRSGQLIPSLKKNIYIYKGYKIYKLLKDFDPTYVRDRDIVCF